MPFLLSDSLQHVSFNSLWFPYLALVKLTVESLDRCLFLESLYFRGVLFKRKGRQNENQNSICEGLYPLWRFCGWSWVQLELVTVQRWGFLPSFLCMKVIIA